MHLIFICAFRKEEKIIIKEPVTINAPNFHSSFGAILHFIHILKFNIFVNGARNWYYESNQDTQKMNWYRFVSKINNLLHFHNTKWFAKHKIVYTLQLIADVCKDFYSIFCYEMKMGRNLFQTFEFWCIFFSSFFFETKEEKNVQCQISLAKLRIDYKLVCYNKNMI